MFTIKKYEPQSLVYTVYGCKSYTVTYDLANRREIIMNDGDSEDDGHVKPRKRITIDGEVFIENAAGKTIEHFYPPSQDVGQMGQSNSAFAIPLSKNQNKGAV